MFAFILNKNSKFYFFVLMKHYLVDSIDFYGLKSIILIQNLKRKAFIYNNKT